MNFSLSNSVFRYVLLPLFLTISCKENQAQEQENIHKFTNALAEETSPYLLQHAHNPVNWRPWSQEALKEAKDENKLVLVSIGYSSCHWCHVMENETFEDEAVAEIMNQNFINIKVDREERPDIDQVYMTALQLISGSGGWPLNVITLPNGKPLYGGTYHTKEQWTNVLTKISNLYKNDPKKAAEYSDMVTQGIANANFIMPAENTDLLTEETFQTSLYGWKQHWDTKEGGDKGTQKFMIPTNLIFLLDYALLSNDINAKAHVKNTLDKMASGGIYDHVGGGFYRYSTDAQWKVPHFEKMLYDNAQVISLYSKAYQVFKKTEYREIVLQTIGFLEREMKHSSGGYFAAINADSDGVEGKFYVWQEEELKTILGADFEIFASYYNIKPNTVWEDGNYVLHKIEEDVIFAKSNSLNEKEVKALVKDWQAQLLNARDNRVRPSTDDKIITSWNALLIKGFVDAYRAFGEREYLEKATSIYNFIHTNSYKNGALVHTYKDGSRQTEGFLEDYTYLADASIELYSATMDFKYLLTSQKLTQKAESLFADADSGMYRYTASDKLISKIIKTDDGVLPSPNAVMANNLFILGHIDYNTAYTEKALHMLSAMVPAITEQASSYSKWNTLLLHSVYPYYEIAVVGKKAKPLINELQQSYIPNTLVIGTSSESDFPLFKDRYFSDGTYIYVCKNTSCKLPVQTVEDAMKQLRNF